MTAVHSIPRRNVIRMAGATAIAGAASGCGERKAHVIDASFASELGAVRRVRFYFGHQSVGRNILDGVARITRHAGSPLAFAESEIGRNGDPASKCNAFRNEIEKRSGNMDIAMMKFCFVDFDAHTNPDDVFAKYSSTNEELRRRYPRLTLMHTTAPLKVSWSGMRKLIKNALGRTDESLAANAVRSRYNELLRARYRGEPIFDLAAVESTEPDGGRATFTADGRTGYSLASAYSSDGGHLNEAGGDRAARELIRVVAAASRLSVTRSSRL
jgi:hypothetical protein